MREHLAWLAKDVSWEEGPAPQLGKRLVDAASNALQRPLVDAPTKSRVKVNTAAARAQSTSLDPTKGQAAKSAAPAGAEGAPHRHIGSSATKGKAR
ncbi:hypothetical protein [Streptomyces avermitilis]|uniref:hypothetical protein n=1 Tax=Streptomyces avermitilis TaxID=33903 RepID=UPI0033A02F4E